MRISYKVFLVGGIPMAIAATIAIVALLLLNQAEGARSGVLSAGTVYRTLLFSVNARDDYLNAAPDERARHAARFEETTRQAGRDLGGLSRLASEDVQRQAIDTARAVLSRYVSRMGELMAVTAENDRLVAAMAARIGSLVTLTDQARERQHASNADIVTSLSDGDARLRGARDIVDAAYELRTAVAAVEVQELAIVVAAGHIRERIEVEQQLLFGLARLKSAAGQLDALLRRQGREDVARQLTALTAAFDARMTELDAAASPQASPQASRNPLTARAGRALAEWSERLLKVNSTEQRALHDEVGELLTYSVNAHETEQATQNIAITTLKLGGRTSEALAVRDADAVQAILTESRDLDRKVLSLPISPLIQTEMVDAIEQWREGLATTANGLREQNAALADMDAAAVTMIENARVLNELFARNANAIGASIRTILIVGAALGLLVGAVLGLIVARSITEPLKRLQQGMVELAGNTHAGLLPDAERRDELGDMARATNVFVSEISRREGALRLAKDEADRALGQLQRTQADLIQAEKLASLGQLVAGVAHEINTPLGIALTTSTLVNDEVGQFRTAANSGRLPRADFERFVQRMTEGSQLLFANLTRAASLVQSFKQVAADQASGERRSFQVKAWLDELLTSLGPVLRKTNHVVSIDCPPGLAADTYPGALGQVLTNLMMNSVVHAYDEGQKGHLRVAVSEPRRGIVRLVFEDDGKGVPAEHVGKVFDPFFTTGRGAGSTGLGLHIVYNLVTGLLQGRIDMDSTPGRGTRFTIDLPKVVTADAAARPELQEAHL